jgi:hypothetical protein
MEQSNSLKSTYIKIALLFVAWGSMVLLRAMIVIPVEPAPVEYVYQRTEKKIEKKIEQRDTIYTLTGDWFFPYNFQLYNFPYYGCGGVVYMDNWGYYGSGPWGGYPLGYNFVFNDGFDSTKKDTANIQNQDSTLVASNDSSSILIVSENSNHGSNSIKHFFQKRSAERIDRRKQRKEKRMLRKSI